MSIMRTPSSGRRGLARLGFWDMHATSMRSLNLLAPAGICRVPVDLLRRFDRLGAHPLGIDAPHLREASEDGDEARGAHLDRLLHHIVEPGVLERSEQILEVRRRCLRPRGFDDPQPQGLAARLDRGAPLPFPAVEEENRILFLEAQHVLEIMAARRRKLDACSGPERILDIEPRRAEIVANHGPLYPPPIGDASAAGGPSAQPRRVAAGIIWLV